MLTVQIQRKESAQDAASSLRSAELGQISPVSIACGLLIAFVLPVQPYLDDVSHVVEGAAGLPPTAAWGVAEVAYELATVALIVVLVRFWEREPLSSIGLRRTAIKEILVGIAGFVAYLIAWGLISHFLARAGSTVQNAIVGATDPGDLPTLPLWLRAALVMGTSFAEEIGARGYAIERLSALTKSRVAGVILAFLGAIAMHVPNYGLTGAIVFVPGQFTFVLLYSLRRSVAAPVTAHILVDGYVMVLWWLLPLSVRVVLSKLGL